MLLSVIFFILLFSIFLIIFTASSNLFFLRIIGLFSSGFTVFLSCLLLLFFNSNNSYFQYINNYKLNTSFINFNFAFGLDGISLFFFILSSFLIFLCILFCWNNKNFKESILNLIIINFFLLLIFSSLDLLIFYVFFEAILIPMYLLIGIWGSRERKIRAVYLFFFYTLFGSLFMLIGLIYIYSILGSLSLEIVLAHPFTFSEQILLWLAFFLSFASKVPLFPFHIWLPEAHVEAPTIGSVLLAGILLKLGIYGFLRFSLTLFPEASFFFSPLIYLFSILGILHASFCAIRQTDLKRIIAYSSIAHMNLVLLGLFSFNIIGLAGALVQSISHGFVSGALFLLIGIIYDRYHSRLLYYYGGLIHTMPIFSSFFLFFILANIAIPGTSSFIGEFLILLGIYQKSLLACLISSSGIVLCAIYSLWLYNRLIFGNLKIIYTSKFLDLNFREFTILLPLFCIVLILGFYPSFIFNFIILSLENLSFSIFQ
jgi:proton-translocating NADH-quinone oxidoreductase chain M